jgi:hypothetical protein
VIVALLDAVAETLQRARLVGMRAVDEDPGPLALQAESKVHVTAEAIRNILQAELVEFVIDFRAGMLEHVLFALEDPQHRTPEPARPIRH